MINHKTVHEQSMATLPQVVQRRAYNKRLGLILLSVAACFFFGIVLKEIFLG